MNDSRNGVAVGVSPHLVLGRQLIAAPTPPGSLLLDGVTPAASAAFSVRRLRTAYEGPLLRVRRSSDNTELDIGYTASDALDTAALLAFCGASTGTVVTWYDQSGNGQHAIQSVGTGPRIVLAGVLDTENGRPSLVGTGAQELMSGSAAYWNRATMNQTLCIVARRTITTSTLQVFTGGSGAATGRGTPFANFELGAQNTNWRVNPRGNPNLDTGGVGDATSLRAIAATSTSTGMDVVQDGTTIYTGTTATATPLVTTSGFAIFSRTNSNVTGKISELVVWKDAVVSPSTRSLVQSNQAAEFATIPGPFTGSAAAFALRVPTGSNYTGPLIRVRRTSDGAEQDIGAVSTVVGGNRWLDTAALLSFTGASSGFIVTWYDQSGNGRHAYTVSTTNPPQIVLNGVVHMLNGNPSAYALVGRGDSNENKMTGVAPMANSSEMTISVVQNVTAYTPSVTWSLAPSSGSSQLLCHMPWEDSNCYFDNGGISGPPRVFGPIGVPPGTPIVGVCRSSVSSSLQQIRINQATIASDTSGHSAACDRVTIMGGDSLVSPVGYFGEFVVFASSLSNTALASLEQNQAAAYGITL